ncbi:MAG: peptide-methionine (S)-S-oxide reductase MsrA [Planctomycetes bacterium]|nr:peptide-methionine (S)-S-oxide reductase MsrA [Planctomycetota bacterium]
MATPAPAPVAPAPVVPAPTPIAPTPTAMPDAPKTAVPARTALATFANGCFWCTEAVLEQQPGVLDVTSGYMGGQVDNPTYKQVCGGDTGHAECVQVTFDPSKIGYETLLDWFFRSHDPTTLNRQGADEGTQYRSAIFVHDDEQARLARAAATKAQANFRDPIVTEITPASRFWPAEAYHQDYFRTNPSQGYCRMVIAPKLKKLGLDAK